MTKEQILKSKKVEELTMIELYDALDLANLKDKEWEEELKEEWEKRYEAKKAEEEKREKEREEKRNQLEKRIEQILGSDEEYRKNLIECNYDKYQISDMMEKRWKIRKELEEMANKYGLDRLDGVMLMTGRTSKGTTKKGNKFYWVGNNGYASRSWYCGTLYINNELIFTSGTVQKAIEYLLEN